MGPYADRVQENLSGSGTGALTTTGAVSGYATLASRFAVNERFRYAIENGAAWEVGIGYLSAGTTLQREQVLASSNSDALINVSGAAVVFITHPAAEIANRLAAHIAQHSNTWI
jgi:hypothetical protein